MTQIQIEINGNSLPTSDATVTVARLKTLGGVPAADDLNLITATGLRLLPDDGSIDLRDGMKFQSTPKTGGAS